MGNAVYPPKRSYSAHRHFSSCILVHAKNLNYTRWNLFWIILFRIILFADHRKSGASERQERSCEERPGDSWQPCLDAPHFRGARRSRAGLLPRLCLCGFLSGLSSQGVFSAFSLVCVTSLSPWELSNHPEKDSLCLSLALRIPSKMTVFLIWLEDSTLPWNKVTLDEP